MKRKREILFFVLLLAFAGRAWIGCEGGDDDTSYDDDAVDDDADDDSADGGTDDDASTTTTTTGQSATTTGAATTTGMTTTTSPVATTTTTVTTVTSVTTTTLHELALDEVDPSSGGASVPTPVTLIGDGFGEGMTVTVGAYPADDVAVQSQTEATAVFPSVPLIERGLKDVTVSFADQTAVLEDGFEYLFDEDPILMVHGLLGHADDFEWMYNRFKELGYTDLTLAAIEFEDNAGSVIPQARDELPPFVEDFLARSGAEKVDVVAHSLGALSARMWIKLYGGSDKVRDIVTLSGVNHGNMLACLTLWWEAAQELCPAYAEQGDSLHDVQWILNGDPDSQDVDETPFGVEEGGGVYWMGAFYTDADLIVMPATSGCLNQSFRNDCSDPMNQQVHGVTHQMMIQDENVFEAVQGLLRQHNPSKP